MKAASLHDERKSGFSLLELLTCVALIGIITALAMPFYTTAEGARDARDKRNAQTLCSICAVAQAAGVSVVNEGDAKIDILRTLSEGVTVESGPLRGRTLSVPNMGDDEVTAASRYVEIENGQLVYNASSVGDG